MPNATKTLFSAVSPIRVSEATSEKLSECLRGLGNPLSSMARTLVESAQNLDPASVPFDEGANRAMAEHVALCNEASLMLEEAGRLFLLLAEHAETE